MNKPTYTTVTPTAEPDDPLAGARGIGNGLLISFGLLLLALAVHWSGWSRLWPVFSVGAVVWAGWLVVTRERRAHGR